MDMISKEEGELDRILQLADLDILTSPAVGCCRVSNGQTAGNWDGATEGNKGREQRMD